MVDRDQAQQVRKSRYMHQLEPATSITYMAHKPGADLCLQGSEKKARFNIPLRSLVSPPGAQLEAFFGTHIIGQLGRVAMIGFRLNSDLRDAAIVLHGYIIDIDIALIADPARAAAVDPDLENVLSARDRQFVGGCGSKCCAGEQNTKSEADRCCRTEGHLIVSLDDISLASEAVVKVRRTIGLLMRDKCFVFSLPGDGCCSPSFSRRRLGPDQNH
jgi:hypothetical protein